VTTQQLLDAVDVAIAAIAANPTAEYEVLGTRWKSHSLPALLRERQSIQLRLNAEQGPTITHVHVY
jgi:hypothetical protein